MLRNRVFISYSHKDRDFLERLQVHLKPLEMKGLVDVWADTKIAAGDDWKQEIDKALQSASVAILLISADFLASRFIVTNELPPLLEAAEILGTRILPVILKPCGFTRTPGLSKFQAVNDLSKPVVGMSHVGRERLWDKVASEVLEIVKQTETKGTTHENGGGEVVKPGQATNKSFTEALRDASKQNKRTYSEMLRYSVGQRVFHSVYGVGVILGFPSMGNRPFVKIGFSDSTVGERTLAWDVCMTELQDDEGDDYDDTSDS